MSPALSLMVATYLLVKLRVLAASDAERDIVGVTVGTLVCTILWFVVLFQALKAFLA